MRLAFLAPLLWILNCLAIPSLLAQIPASATAVQHELVRGAKVHRERNKVWIVPESTAESGSVSIPRFCAPVRSLSWVGEESEVLLVPEPGYWKISWKKPPAASKTIQLLFESEALFPSEQMPVVPTGDGTIVLHAFQGMTEGDKLRFEPQPHKNTIGYWTAVGDSVRWTFRADAAGSYSVGLLQGCGQGQGGSQARIQVTAEGKDVASQEFDTIDTGHFQNFRWNHVGKIDLPRPGVYQLTIRPIKIAKAALFDVRFVQLVRQAK
ncbi:MAG: hypothetical protein ABL921_01375 [Pirellula sp.]